MPTAKTTNTWIDTEDKWLSESESLNNAQIVANFFTAQGWTPDAIAALCGNMRHESSINPNMWEYGYGHSRDRGYGLVQWTPASKYIDWATSNGMPWANGDSQLARIDFEQQEGIQWISTPLYPMTFNQFTRSTGDISYLTQAFTWNYERPARGPGEESMPARIAFAQRVFNEISFEGGVIHFIFPTVERVTSGFRTPERPDHHGVDFAEPGYHEIKASAGGVVTRSGWSDSYGEVIYILHKINGQEWETVYAHMESGSRRVVEGDFVSQGQVIGVMGNTGDSHGQHLHFELHKGRWNEAKSNAVDPMLYLGKSSGGGGSDDKDKEKMMIITRRHNTNMRRMGVRGR